MTSSTRTVEVALAANIGVAVAKVTAAILTASTAMTAEAAHACADVGNQCLLVVAQRRSVRAADARHPLGYGREAYFWALLASVVVFVAGAVFSFRARRLGGNDHRRDPRRGRGATRTPQP